MYIGKIKSFKLFSSQKIRYNISAAIWGTESEQKKNPHNELNHVFSIYWCQTEILEREMRRDEHHLHTVLLCLE